MNDKTTNFEDDGLVTPIVGIWAEQKYHLIAYYAALFASGMKEKWGKRIYLDLFAGAGRARIRGTRRIIAGTPLQAIKIPTAFDHYIFCDADTQQIQALHQRVESEGLDLHVTYINEDVNSHTEDILQAIPQASKASTVLCFCVVDPYRLGDIKHSTIKQLSVRYMDFLVIIPSYMDGHRNKTTYLKHNNENIEGFLGLQNWRDQWKSAESKGEEFGRFITSQFGQGMKTLGFKHGGLEDTILIRSKPQNLPLYHLGFYSRHPKGLEFWKKAKNGTKRQLELSI